MFRNCCNNRQNMMGYDIPMMMQGTPIMEGQVIEPTITKCIEKEFYHEVPHVCPIRTRIINHHVYKHTYRQTHSCCSEDKITNLQCGSCCNFE